MKMYFCIQLKIHGFRAHLSIPRADRGEKGLGSRRGQTGREGGNEDSRALSREVSSSTGPSLKTVQPRQNTLGISGLVINAPAGGLNHSGMEVARRLTV